jgi:peptidoglycan-N-acetylglucosamine deacetylase
VIRGAKLLEFGSSLLSGGGKAGDRRPGWIGRMRLALGRLSRFGLSRYISNGEWLPELRYLPGGASEVALSFDDGPTPETTLAVLNILSRYRAKATFFLTGARAAANPLLAQAIVDAGHDVFCHGWDHIRYDEVGSERLICDMERCETILKRFRKTPSPYLVRLPYTAGHRSARVHRALRCWNPTVQLAHYSVTLNDWSLGQDCKTSEDVETRVAQALSRLPYARLPGKIILLHEAPFDSQGSKPMEAPPDAAVAPILLERMLAEFAPRGLRATTIAPLSRQAFHSKYLLPPRRKVVVQP